MSYFFLLGRETQTDTGVHDNGEVTAVTRIENFSRARFRIKLSELKNNTSIESIALRSVKDIRNFREHAFKVYL